MERAAWTSKEDEVTPPLLVEASLKRMMPESSSFCLGIYKQEIKVPGSFGDEEVGSFDDVLEPGRAVLLVHVLHVVEVDGLGPAAARHEEVSVHVLVQMEVVAEVQSRLDHGS